MELKNVKVGQRVFVKRESTAKLEGTEAFAQNMIILLNKVFGDGIVEICKKENGFYVVEIRDDGNVNLGKKEDGELKVGWGTWAPSDFELAEEETPSGIETLIDILNKLDEKLAEIRAFYKVEKPAQKRKRGRPRKTK